ncbi:hypothetical protein APHAL10511_004221 [Amanita phalloides]|nr:hypothetical protein APHAL10511_004221 [Amanita phalloides]
MPHTDSNSHGRVDDVSKIEAVNAIKKRGASTEVGREGDDGSEEGGNGRKKVKVTGNTTGLEDLLDISELCGAQEIDTRFEAIANVILCDYHLVVESSQEVGSRTETRYEVLELEFYLWMDDSHEDPFTHGSEEQRVSGRWYFHRSPKRSTDSHRTATSLSGYRGGSRKGLDLTIGRRHASTSRLSPSRNIRGGILLRTLRRTSDVKVICGPSLLVDEILKVSRASSISELVERTWDSSTGRTAFRPEIATTDSRHGTHLTFRPRGRTTERPTIYRSPRIGLDLSHPGTTPTRTHPRLQFLPRTYRFFVRPELLDKGRPQTFIGVLHANQCATPSNAKTLRSKVTQLMGIKQTTYDKYYGDYTTGLDKGAIRTYVGVAGKGASSSPGTYLRMVGALERFLGASSLLHTE